MANDTVKSEQAPWLLGSRLGKIANVGQECVNFFWSTRCGPEIVTSLRPQFEGNDLGKRSEFVAALRQHLARKRKPTTVLSQEEAEWVLTCRVYLMREAGSIAGAGEKNWGEQGKAHGGRVDEAGNPGARGLYPVPHNTTAERGWAAPSLWESLPIGQQVFR